MHQLGGEGALTHLGKLRGGFVVVAELGDATQREGDGVVLCQGQQPVSGKAKGQRIEARQGIVLAVEQGVERPLSIAGGAAGRFAIFAQQGDVPTPLHQRERRHGGSDAATDDEHLSLPPCGAGIPGCDALLRHFAFPNTRQHLPLAAVALHLLHGKAGGNQPPSHETGAGKGREGGIGAGEASEIVEEILGPHLWVLGRGETVQIPGVHQTGCRMGHLGQHLLDVAKPEIEADAAIGKEQAMAAGDRQRPLVDERLAQGGKLGPGGQGLAQIGLGKRVFLDADEVQPGSVAGQGGLFQKGGHCGQKVKSCTETCFTNHETVTIVVRKSLWQSILLQKDVAGFT